MTADELAGRYGGRTVVCAASGPSLTTEDLQLARDDGLSLIVVNNTWRLAPWADMLVAMDTAWWRKYGVEAEAGFAGLRVGFTVHATKWGASHSTWGHMVHNFGNSGAAAIAVAVRAKADAVLLIGFDAGAGPNGEMHWHADHDAPLKNPQASIGRWPQQFERVGKHAREHGVRIVNCSRRTALDCFERMSLEEALRNRQTAIERSSGSSMSEACGGSQPARPPSGSVTGTSPSTTPAM